MFGYKDRIVARLKTKYVTIRSNWTLQSGRATCGTSCNPCSRSYLRPYSTERYALHSIVRCAGSANNRGVMKRIMLVDDNDAIRRSLHHVFDFNPDWDVCGEASNGLEGVEKAKTLHPDLIVMDVSMPVMNGLEAARVIHETMPGVLVILCSLYTDDSLRSEAREAGVRAIVSKTQNVQMLVSKARELLQRLN